VLADLREILACGAIPGQLPEVPPRTPET